MTACFAARSRILTGNRVHPQNLVAYYSDQVGLNKASVGIKTIQSHSCVSRAAKMSLMQCRPIDGGKDARLEADELIAQMTKDLQNGLIPTFVVVTLGTTGLCAFDDLNGVAKAVRNGS